MNTQGFDAEDNPIDWSAFDEKERAVADLEGSKQLRIVSIAMMLLAVVGIVIGITSMNDALGSLSKAADGQTELVGNFGMYARPAFLIFYAMLTLVPAAFGLQTAKSSVSFVAPTVLGVAGIVVSALCGFGFLFVDAISGVGNLTMPVYMFICAVVAVVYLMFVVRVHKSANAAGGVQRRRPTKEELWDEDKIWQ